MNQKANIHLREFGKNSAVQITSKEKPPVPVDIMDKWQRIVNLIATLIHIPSALIMRVTQTHIEVFLRSDNTENPYTAGGLQQLGGGLYCETVLGTKEELLIENALSDRAWKDNPDVRLDMISYYGLPICWPDGDVFGTICVLDNKTNRYNETFKALLKEFKASIERDLDYLIKEQKLKTLAEHDGLTALYNRRKIEDILEAEYQRSKRYATPLSVILMDLDRFKKINDTHGHDIGDAIIKCFANSIIERVRTVDHIGRWGGDEFLLICPNTVAEEAEILMKGLKSKIVADMQDIVAQSGFSYGIAEYDETETDCQDLVKRADEALYSAKKYGRNPPAND